MTKNSILNLTVEISNTPDENGVDDTDIFIDQLKRLGVKTVVEKDRSDKVTTFSYVFLSTLGIPKVIPVLIQYLSSWTSKRETRRITFKSSRGIIELTDLSNAEQCEVVTAFLLDRLAGDTTTGAPPPEKKKMSKD